MGIADSADHLKQTEFMALYAPVHNRLSRFVQSRVWNRDEAKDIVSDTVLAAYEHFGELRKKEAFLYYLFTIATRVLRKKESRQRWFTGITEKQEAIAAGDEQAEKRLLKRELYQALGKLSYGQREAITLFEIAGFSIREIAEMQQMSESGVKSNLKRGREKLAMLLTDHQKELTSGMAYAAAGRKGAL